VPQADVAAQVADDERAAIEDLDTPGLHCPLLGQSLRSLRHKVPR
jgi:hypothetical protein